MHAEYDRESDDYNAHRVVQAFDTAQFIQHTRGESVLQVLAGDLNTEPGDLAHRVLLAASHLEETYNPTDHGSIGTNECAHNTYTPLSVKKSLPNGKRIDYILFRSGAKTDVQVQEFALPLPEFIPDKKISFSDHEAVYAKLLVTDRPKGEHCETNSCVVAKKNGIDFETTLQEAIKVCDDILKRLYSDKRIYFMMATTMLVGLLYTIDYTPAYGWKTLYFVIKMIFSGVALFFIFMATMWNSIERNGILSSKLSMEMALQTVNLERNIHRQSCF